jgi:hypothetical protein
MNRARTRRYFLRSWTGMRLPPAGADRGPLPEAMPLRTGDAIPAPRAGASNTLCAAGVGRSADGLRRRLAACAGQSLPPGA